MARTKNNVRSFAPWTSQGLARVVGRSNNEPAKERSTLITPEKQPLGPATATPDHAIQPPLPSLAPPLESDRSSRLSRTQPYNPAIRHAPLEELTPRNLYNNFPSPAGPATPVVPPPPSPPSQPHPAVAAVTKGVQGRDEPGLRSGCARLEQADGAGPSQPAAGSGVAAAAEARPEPSQPAAASPQQPTRPGPAATLHGYSGAMHAQLPSLAKDPAPFMQANTTPMPTHYPVVDAPELQPGSIAHCLHMAWMLQSELVGCRRSLTATQRPIHQNTSQRFLNLMATAGSEVIFDSRRDKDMVPVICIPSDIQSSLHQLPPPFLARFQGINDWKMLWKAPSFPWSSMLHQWVNVDWIAPCPWEPGAILVLGLRASGRPGSPAHGPTSLHTPQAQTASPWPPPFQHQGVQDAQLAATARQMPLTACGAAAPPVPMPAPPCGPGPKEGRQDCSGVQGQANVGPERDHIHQEHCTSTPPQQPRPVSDGRQGEEVKAFIEAAYPPVAPTAAQPGPGTNRERLMKAIQLQRQLLSDRLPPPGGVAPVHSTTSHTILRMMATAPSMVDMDNMWDERVVPVICMPCGGQSSLPELPPPFLVRIRGNNPWEMVWKASSFPWSSLLQLWEMVVWSTEAPGGHLVLWLRAAASTGSPAHGPTSLHTPQVQPASPRPPLYTPHQQGQDAQLTATARQIPAVGRQVATPPVATPAPPCGPRPKERRQDCSAADHGTGTMQLLPGAAVLAPAPPPELPGASNLGGTSRDGAGPSQHAAGLGGVAAEARPGPSQPAAAPGPAEEPEGRVVPNSWAGFKRNVSDTVQGNAKRQCGSQGHSPSLAAGVAQPAPDQGPEDMEVAPAALPESPAPDGGAAAAGGLGTAEEGGPGPSQPAAGMAGAPDEGDPEVPQPAAAPAHAVSDLPVTWTRPAPGEGQAIDVIEVIDLTQDEPDIPQGSGAMQPAPESEAPLLAPNLELPGASTPDQDPEEMEVAPAALPESPAPAGGAAAAAGLGTAEEGGPGPSQPAAGMAGAPDEGDPEVSQPAAAPAHAGVEGAGGCSLGASHDGLLPDAAAPPCQAALLAPLGTPDTGITASPHSRPATLASCPAPCLALGGDSASSPEPAGGQQDGALSSDAEEVALLLSGAGLAAGPLPLPSWVSDMVNRANEVQLSLQHNPANWHRAPEPTSDDASHYLLSFISQPALAVDWKEQTMEFVIPVVCVPHDGLPSQHQLPPPFLITTMRDHQLAVVWKPPDWPWSSVQQHWERVVWTALTQGHMVVGLSASGNACHEAGVSISP